MISLSLLALPGLVLAQGSRGDGTDVTRETASIASEVVDNGLVPFAGKMIGREEAYGLAQEEGLTLMAYDTCELALGGQQCLALLVRKARTLQAVPVYAYYLLSTRCESLTKRARSRVDCFAGYVTVARERPTWFATFEEGGRSFFQTSDFELFGGLEGRKPDWQLVVTKRSYDSRRPLSGGRTEIEESLALFGPSSEEIYSSSTTAVSIAGTGEGRSVGAVELCTGMRDSLVAWAEFANSKALVSCEATLPESVTLSGDAGGGINLGAVGTLKVVGSATWDTTKICSFLDSRTHTAAVAADAYLDCLKEPGRYFPEHYPSPEVKAIQFTQPPLGEDYFLQNVLADWAPPTHCEDFTQEAVSVDMGGGVYCTGTVDYSCSSAPGGGCHCEPAAARNLACVGVPDEE